MKIIVFCHDAYMSGANLSLKDWINSDKKNEYYIVIPKKNKDFARHFQNNVKIIYSFYFCYFKNLNKVPLILSVKKIIKMFYMKTIGKIYLKKFFKKLNKLECDVVISNSFAVYYGALFAQMYNKKHVWYIREFMEEDHGISHYNSKQIKSLANYSSAIFISNVIREKYEKIYDFKKTQVINDQVEINQMCINKEYKPFDINSLNLIMVGILSEGKGQKEAIGAIEELARQGYNCNLDIYGKGPLENSLKQYIKLHNLNNIKLKGYCNNLSNIRKNYDIALVCSKNEGLGRVTIEAMYYGNLVIGANCGCTKDIISDGRTGYLYDQGDVKNLALKIIEVTKNPKKSNKILEQARLEAINNFSNPIFDKVNRFLYKVIREE